MLGLILLEYYILSQFLSHWHNNGKIPSENLSYVRLTLLLFITDVVLSRSIRILKFMLDSTPKYQGISNLGCASRRPWVIMVSWSITLVPWPFWRISHSIIENIFLVYWSCGFDHLSNNIRALSWHYFHTWLECILWTTTFVWWWDFHWWKIA